MKVGDYVRRKGERKILGIVTCPDFEHATIVEGPDGSEYHVWEGDLEVCRFSEGKLALYKVKLKGLINAD